MAGGLLALCLGLSQAIADFNFTVAKMEDSSGEGPERDRPYFMMGKQRIAFSQPFKSTITSGPEKLTLHFTERGWLGVIDVTASPLTPREEFFTATEEYFQNGAAEIPPEAEEVEFKGANPHQYAVNEWKSQVFEWTYRLSGRRYLRQVAYINIDEEHQVRMRIVCTPEEAKTLVPLAKRFLASWYFASSVPKQYIK